MNLQTDKLKNVIASLPDKPGVYQFINKKEEIIYIGKAKSLKKRVSSYLPVKAIVGKQMYWSRILPT